jgi:hypothetical protein
MSVFITSCLDARKSLVITKKIKSGPSFGSTNAVAGTAVTGLAVSGSIN